MLAQAQREQLTEQGYAVFPDLMPAAMLAAMRARVEALYAEEGDQAGREFKHEPGALRMAN